MNRPNNDTRAAMMERALREARAARGRTRPNPAVGCVIANGDQLIAVGRTQPVGGHHAEVEALNAAGERACGADAYVTLEPCNHYGRTPPCTEALIQAGVARVFIGVGDPHPLVDGRGIRRLREHGIEVEVGVLDERCRRMHEDFIHYVRTRRPFVVGKVAQSLDGRVATRTGDSKWITGEEARRRGHELRNTLDAITVGVGTVLADDPSLTCRIDGGRDPVRVVLDTHARTPPDSNVVAVASQSAAPTWIMVGEQAPADRCDALRERGVSVITCAMRDGRLWLDDVLVRLGERDILSLLVEGGPTVIGALRDRDLLNKLYLFIAPTLIGGAQALSSVGAEGAGSLSEASELEIVDREWLGQDLLLTAYPKQR